MGLSELDKDILQEGKWLSSNHMSAAQNLLKQIFPEQRGLQDTCQLASKKWYDLPNEFVQIVHVQPRHWACVSNKLSEDREISLYDSMHTVPDDQSSIVAQVCTILNSEDSDVVINVIDVQMQCGMSDCGLFAIAMATDLCYGLDPFRKCYCQDQMRQHLKKCFDQFSITPFPTKPSLQKKRNRVLLSLTVDIFCICRQPERMPMVECDYCNVWYHDDCINLSSDILAELEKNSDITWFCPSCKCITSKLYIALMMPYLSRCHWTSCTTGQTASSQR